MSEWLINVFSQPPVRMNICRDQEEILNIEEHGQITAALHVSVHFPEMLASSQTRPERTTWGVRNSLNGPHADAIKMAGQSVNKLGEVSTVQVGGFQRRGCFSTSHHRSKRVDVVKPSNDRRHEISKARERLNHIYRDANFKADCTGRTEVWKRW